MKKQFLLATLLLFFITVLSCKEQLIETQTDSLPVQSANYSNARENLSNDDSPMVLGKKLENP